MKSDGVIAMCSKARQMLAEAKTLEEFKAVRDVGEAAIRLAKSRRDVGIEAVQEAQEIVRRAERDMGAILPSVIGGPGKLNGGRLQPLESLGIEKTQSSRFQKIANLPDDEFEAWIEDCRSSGEEMTQAAALRLAAAFLADPIEKPESPPHEQMASAVKNAFTKFVGQLTTPDQYAYVRLRMTELLEFLAQMEAENGVGRQGQGGPVARAG